MASSAVVTESSPLLREDAISTKQHKTKDAIENGVSVSDTDSEQQEEVVSSSRAAQFAGNAEARNQLKYIVPAVSIGIFMAAADQTLVVASYGRIGSEMEALQLSSWIGTGYFLSLTAFQPLYGIGGGGATSVVSILISDIVPLNERGLWQGFLNIIYATGSGSGAPLGGMFADSIGWRWAFLMQVPLCVVSLAAVGYGLKLPTQDEENWKKKLRRIDFYGAATLVLAILGLLFGLDRGSNQQWDIPICYGPLVGSVGFSAIFIYIEQCVAREPFAPGRIIFSKDLIAGFLCNSFSFATWLPMMYFLPFYQLAVEGISASLSGLRLLFAVIAGSLGSIAGGLIIKRTGRYYWLTITGYGMQSAGMCCILLFTGLVVESDVGISVGMVLAGLGSGIGATSSLIALLSNAEPEDQAVTTACSYLFRSLGSTVGVALCATVLQQRLKKELGRELGNGKEAKKLERRIRRSLSYVRSLEPALRRVVTACYANAVTSTFALMLGISFAAFFSSWFIREKRLTR